MKEIYRWISKVNEKCEYHFVNGLFVKFTIDGVTQEDTNNKYKGKEFTDKWKENLKICGFLKINK